VPKKQAKKLRVDFRKNRSNTARRNDITRAVHSEGVDVDGLDRGQRVSGKGDLTRKRTVVGAHIEGEHVVIEVDEAQCRRGRIIAAIGSTQCTVQADPGQPEAGRRYECTVRRVVRTVARDARNAVVAGDHVLFRPSDDQQGVIERVEPRQGVLARGHQYKQHILVANITQAAIVSSVADPVL
jgi:ribosome biogenesis GTPase